MSENTPPHESDTFSEDLVAHSWEVGLGYIHDAVLITEAEPFDRPGPKILWANDAFYQLTGYSSSEVIGNTPRMLQGPLTDKSSTEDVRAALEKWEVTRAEVLNYKKDGSTFWNEFEATPIANEAGFYTHWISIQRDVTLRRNIQLAVAKEELTSQNEEKNERAKEILLANERLAFQIKEKDERAIELVRANHELAIQKTKKELFEYTKSIVNTVREPLILLDPDFKVLSVNHSFYQLFKVNSRDTIGRNINRLGNHQWDISDLQELLGTILLHKASFDDYEVVHDFIGIGRRTMLLNARELEQVEGKSRLILLAIEDITQRKEIEAGLEQNRLELAALAAKLERANQIKSEFLASMSHELRTPLNSIIGFSEVLKDDLAGKLNDEQYKYVRYIFDSGEHLLSLINDILDLSKVEAGMMNLNLDLLSIETILHDSFSMIKEKSTLQGINLNEDIEIKLGNIQADGRKIKQIIYNLLSNAVKFTPSGGEVTLSAHRVYRSKVGLVASNKSWHTRVVNGVGGELDKFDEFLEISVRDTGIGVSRTDLNKLFQPFSQIDSSLSRAYEGTGLGLVMVQNIARLHGGMTAVSSGIDKGSCFTVWLPWRDTSTRVEPRFFTPLPTISEGLVNAIPTEDNHLPLALIVEEDDNSAELIRLLLKMEGFSVRRAKTAEEALTLLEGDLPVLMTVDIHLPGMDVWTFLSRCKQIPGLEQVPVVIISLDGDKEPCKGWAMGASLVLEKPVGLNDLRLAMVRFKTDKALDLKGMQILVADEDPIAADKIATLLADMGAVPMTAYGGGNAIEKVLRSKPDLIILDLLMPDVSGFDVANALKKNPETAGIPIIIITAKTLTVQDKAMLNGRIHNIIEKSRFNNKTFRLEVQRALEGISRGENHGSHTVS